MKRLRSCSCFVIGLAVVIGGWALTLWAARDRSPRLLDLAKHVYHDPELFSTQNKYLWTTTTSGVSINLFHRPNQPNLWKALIFNTVTGQHTEIKLLSASLFNHINGAVSIAPGANYVLMQDTDPKSKKNAVASAFDMIGRKLATWHEKSPYVAEPLLLTQPRRWVELVGSGMSTQCIVHNFDGSETNPRKCPMPDNVYWIGQKGFGQVLSYTIDYGSNDEETYRLLAFNPLTMHAITGRHLPIPEDASINYAEVSPNGHRILFMLQSGGGSYYPLLFRDLLSYRVAEPHTPVRWALWTCNTDGTSLHEIGCIRSDEDPGGIIGVTWLPDNKSISFINHGWLHIVAAP